MQNNSGEGVNLFHNQDFYSIRDWCLKRGYLFEDPYFKLDFSHEWLRPWQIVQNPQLYIGRVSRFDIRQGELGDCWMLASIAALGMYPDLVKKVIPEDQSFSSQYAGIFHFRFWRFGKWVEVVIDDRLPTKNGKLVFTRSIHENEFWSPLLEKAYCKILGGEYSASDAGNLCEALEDFTGGVVEQYALDSVPQNMPDLMVKYVGRSSLMGCFIDNLADSSEAHTPEGLVRGHSYSITGASNVSIPGYGNTVMIRVRNPWGYYEWTGPWSDGSPEWNYVPESTKQQLGLAFKDDGEFWMDYQDFVTRFQWIDMCQLRPGVFFDESGRTSDVGDWQLNEVRGSWVRGVTAGGEKNLSMNPQIQFYLNAADDDNNDGLCSVLVALMQKQNGHDANYFEIGLRIYQLYDRASFLDQRFFDSTRPIAEIEVKGVREVAQRYDLPPGLYCVVPFTHKTGREGDFLMRIYTEKRVQIDDGYRIGLSPEDINNETTPKRGNWMKMDKRRHIEEVAIEPEVKEVFEKESNHQNDIDWKKLKQILDGVTKNSLPSVENDVSSWGHFLVDSLTYVWNNIFKPSVYMNPFDTIGPQGFSKELCRSMIALLDSDHSGKLTFNEFSHLWTEVKHWKTIYEQHGKHTGGYLTPAELKSALESEGLLFNKETLSHLVRRYSTKDEKISFDDFLLCAIKAKTMAAFFKSKGKSSSLTAEMTLEDFMAKAMYA